MKDERERYLDALVDLDDRDLLAIGLDYLQAAVLGDLAPDRAEDFVKIVLPIILARGEARNLSAKGEGR